MTFADSIIQLRSELRISQKELAEQLNISVATVNRWENGRTEPNKMPEIEENGTTFAENAEIKARAVWNCTGDIVLADDSGLVVDYIGGEPGIYSARYMGEDTSYEIKNQNIIDRLADARGGERSARFVCNIAAVLPDGRVLHTEAAMEGQIAMKPAGCGGFGYDPILYLPEFGMTSAEITLEQKNQISHRGKALEAMKQELKHYFEEES